MRQLHNSVAIAAIASPNTPLFSCELDFWRHPVSHSEAGCCSFPNPLSGVIARCPLSSLCPPLFGLGQGGLARIELYANRRVEKEPLLAGNRTYAHFRPHALVAPSSPRSLDTRFALPSCPIPPKNKTYFGCKAGKARHRPSSPQPHS